ncbi:hypothetical protein AK812_SmicGene20435 [Symbiodinium microadriaticum]|uniref:Uncharacterized protein n=1 Tax=Symbiodinium microadriaticum TaxID=2951 RepID=A0A1Q9DQ20_SYMMI|nr:hypothetical protein AK812_SmicGene20435 [Symbiodinium microadriaticum]
MLANVLNPVISTVRAPYDLDVLQHRISAASAQDSRCWTGSASEVSHVQTTAQHNLGDAILVHSRPEMMQWAWSLLLSVVWAGPDAARQVLTDSGFTPLDLAAGQTDAEKEREKCGPFFEFFEKRCKGSNSKATFKCMGGVRSEGPHGQVEDSFKWCEEEEPFLFKWGEPVCYVHTDTDHSLWAMVWCPRCLGSVCLEPITFYLIIAAVFLLCNCACCALICRCVYKKADEHDIPRRVRASIAGAVGRPSTRPSQMGVELNDLQRHS